MDIDEKDAPDKAREILRELIDAGVPPLVECTAEQYPPIWLLPQPTPIGMTYLVHKMACGKVKIWLVTKEEATGEKEELNGYDEFED